MAYRSSASATVVGGATNITATPTGVVAHDYLGALYCDDVSGGGYTAATGWSERVNNDLAGPDTQTMRQVAKNDATGTDSFVFNTGTGGGHASLITAAWSGRDNTTPHSTTPVSTNNTSSNTSPISISATGITATANDDIAVWSNLDQQQGTDTWGYSAATNYVERQDIGGGDWAASSQLQTRDNVSGGATGALTYTATRASGSSNAGYGVIVVAIKASGGGGAAGTGPLVNGGSLLRGALLRGGRLC